VVLVGNIYETYLQICLNKYLLYYHLVFNLLILIVCRALSAMVAQQALPGQCLLSQAHLSIHRLMICTAQDFGIVLQFHHHIVQVLDSTV